MPSALSSVSQQRFKELLMLITRPAAQKREMGLIGAGIRRISID
jgi:hypothetical protein